MISCNNETLWLFDDNNEWRKTESAYFDFIDLDSEVSAILNNATLETIKKEILKLNGKLEDEQNKDIPDKNKIAKLDALRCGIIFELKGFIKKLPKPHVSAKQLEREEREHEEERKKEKLKNQKPILKLFG